MRKNIVKSIIEAHGDGHNYFYNIKTKKVELADGKLEFLKIFSEGKLGCVECHKKITNTMKGAVSGNTVNWVCSNDCGKIWWRKHPVGVTEGQFYSHWGGNPRYD